VNELQQRPQIYVLGPNQDARLSSVAAGAEIAELLLTVDTDAPFMLTGRSLRCTRSTDSGLNQAPLQFLQSRWTGPHRDYRHQSYLLESLQMAYFGQIGNPKPIAPGVLYPPGSTLMVDIRNRGSSAIPNLTFFWVGFKMFPPGAVPAYTYPEIASTQTFSYPVFVSQLAYNEIRRDQIFTVKPDADFVWRAGQGIPTVVSGGRVLSEVSVIFKDHEKNPYMSDFVPFDILFGVGGFPSAFPLGPTPVFVPPFGTGPASPGILYPEIYLPKNHQLLYDLKRAETVSRPAEDFQFNLIGAKVWAK